MRLETISESDFLAVAGMVTCPRCGEDIEIWCEGAEAACEYCDYKLFKKERLIH